MFKSLRVSISDQSAIMMRQNLKVLITICVLNALSISLGSERVECGLVDIISDLNPSTLKAITTTSTEDLVRQAGYIAETHNLPTQPGYVINLIRIINDKVKRKANRTALFVHGVLENSNQWVLMGVKNGRGPSDWTNVSSSMSEPDLQSLIGNDKTASSMPFLLSNCGFDLILMNRRNTKQSRSISPKNRPIGTSLASNLTQSLLTSLNNFSNLYDDVATLLSLEPSGNPYFDFSHDEQSQFDIPAVIKYVLKLTGASVLDYIGHATGVLVGVQALAREPELGKLINHLVILAPMVNEHNLYYQNEKNYLVRILASQEYKLSTTVGSLNPVAVLPALLLLEAPVCAEHALQGEPCGSPNDEIFGYGSNQLDQTISNGAILSWSAEASLHELAQIVQSIEHNEIHYFDMRDQEKNLQAYGSLDIPKYHLNLVSANKISVWRGNTDRFANKYDVQTDIDHLEKPVTYRVIGNETQGVLFNHLAFLFHRDVLRLLNIPLLQVNRFESVWH